MKKIFLISAICCFCAMPAALSSTPEKSKDKSEVMLTVTGQVTDHESGEALAGVLVRVGDSKSRIYTDFEGRFEIAGLNPGTYSISTSLISYEKTELKMELNGEESESIKIKLNQVSLK